MKLHDKPCTCPVQLCAYRTAKSRDMRRHLATRHPDYIEAQNLRLEPRPICPEAGCKYAQLGFARKDHLTRHLRRMHPGQFPKV